MPVSQNGYPANDRSLIHNPKVPGTQIDFPGGVRRGPAGDLLVWVAEQLHRRVENGGTGYGMWGYAERPIRGGTQLSNHASGTAIDWHAPRHPLGAVGTFSATQVRTIHAILREAEGCVRWGGDYSGRKDEMHFEIVKSEAACASALRGLSQAQPVPGGIEEMAFGDTYTDWAGNRQTVKSWMDLQDKRSFEAINEEDVRRVVREEIMHKLVPVQGEGTRGGDTNLWATLGWFDAAHVANRKAVVNAESRIMARLDAIEARLSDADPNS